MRNIIITKRMREGNFKIKNGEFFGMKIILEKGWDKRKKLTFELEENAELNFKSLIIGRKKEKFPFEIIIIHKGEKTRSSLDVKAALMDESEIDFKGLVRIEKNAKFSKTNIIIKALLLSQNAKAKALPSLEIENNDVKANHSATIGKINEEELFYLKSRGINEIQAKNLIIEGFLKNNLITNKNV